MRRYILGIDEGTTSARSVLYDIDQNEIVDIVSKPIKQFYPHDGWVEQDANEISRKVLSNSRALLARNSVTKDELLGIGITNQRETIVAWNKETGEPIYHAIVWQCRRTTADISKLSEKNKKLIKQKTGLIANSYFSASKMKWIMDNVKEAKTLAKKNKLCFGTIDCYLNYKLTGNFYTDTTNASRTMLMNLKTLQWDDQLLSMFKIPKSALPEILASDAHFGNAKKLFGAPICAMIGDQMSSMFGQGAIHYGNTKVTFGTGGFVLCNIGSESGKNVPNLLTTVAATINGKTEYAIEGSIYSACSAVNWLKYSLNMFEEIAETGEMANSLKSNEGVYLVPAFTGLGAPYWNDSARATIVGMTFDTKKEHIVRATLESMAYNTKAIFDELKKTGHKFKMISVDGGGSKNKFVLQFLADMLKHDIVKSKFSESTVLGAVFVAMISLKIIKPQDILKLTESKNIYKPNMDDKTRKRLYQGWLDAIKKV